ncbi:hypothetical protein BGW37DRAFT_508358 [Umbelopsis sp. PMI_123]|nr:hypothetical protein BGW37DRAFT_508358 [Umbelopsis sp. PMI_123]
MEIQASLLTYPPPSSNINVARNTDDNSIKADNPGSSPLLTPSSMAGMFTPTAFPDYVSLYEDQKVTSNPPSADLTPQSTAYPAPDSTNSPIANPVLQLLPKYEKRKSSPAALESTFGFDEQPANFNEPRNSIEAAMLLANFTRSPAFLSRTPSDKDIFGNKVTTWNDGFSTPPPLPSDQTTADISPDHVYKQPTSRVPTPQTQMTNDPWRPLSTNPYMSDEPTVDLMRRHSYDVSTSWRNNQPAVDRATLLQMAGGTSEQTTSAFTPVTREPQSRQDSAPVQTVFTFTSEDGTRLSWMPSVSFEQASGPTTSFLSQPSPSAEGSQDLMIQNAETNSLKRSATPSDSKYELGYIYNDRRSQTPHHPLVPNTPEGKPSKPKKARAKSPATESFNDDVNTEVDSDEWPDMTPKDVQAALTDPEARPRQQKLRYTGDQYTPKWVRYNGQAKEGLCDTCSPGKWLQLKNSAYWYHKQFFHGISSVSGKQFTGPIETRWVDQDVKEGLCHQCHQWVPVSNVKRKNSVLWYRHAHKCHVYHKPKAPAKRH